jgi:hypothetical protein
MNVLRVGWAVFAAAMMLAACSGGQQGHAGGPQPKATNPVAFPLFSGAEVLSSREWQETVTSRPGAADSALLSQGAGTYDGHDVVAGTQAMMPSLESWLRDLDAHPPDGYSSSLQGVNIDAVRDHTRDLGIDFAVFQRNENGKQHGVVVLAVDPQMLDAKAGPMLGAIGKFKMMPQMFRDQIDSSAKKQTGFSVTELTNPNSPIGAAIAALDQLRDYGGRGVVIIDATKQ